MTRTLSPLGMIAALAVAAAAQPAAAQSLHLYDGVSHDPGKIVTYTRIHFSRAEAQSPAGAREVLQQIEGAADAVCGREVHAKVSPADYEACRSDAVEGAVRTLGTPAIRSALAERRRAAQYAAN